MKPLRVIGLMSGSSLDGLDIVMCEFSYINNSIQHNIISSTTIPYDLQWVSDLSNIVDLNVAQYFTINTEYSIYIANLVKEYCTSIGLKPDLIASHGHTIDHRPAEGISVQIGDPAIISTITGIDCVADFRIQDIILGGQGAPIIPIAEKLIYTDTQCFINLGGIANISIHDGNNIKAWDSVPCNQVLNDQSEILGANYDDAGNWAREGNISDLLLDEWNSIDYFERSIPKTLDNTWIKNHFTPIVSKLNISPKDALATMCEFIAHQISNDLIAFSNQSIPNRIMVTGGGAFNSYLLERITHYTIDLNTEIYLPDPIVINFKEAVMIALMGYLFINNIENTIANVTGASKATIAGKYCKG